MRPFYETSQDLVSEAKVAEALEKRWTSRGVSLLKLPIKYGADYGVYEGGKLKAWLEVKCRRVAFSKYPDVILSVDKWAKAQDLAKRTGSRFLLVVSFTDGIYLAEETNRTREAYYGGRTDRDDWQDQEPVVRIPTTEFKKVLAP